MKKKTRTGQRLSKRILSFMLVFAMTVTMIAFPSGESAVMAEGEGAYIPATEMMPTDQVQIRIGDKVSAMPTYLNGVYEYAAELEAGTYTADILINGEKKCSSKEVKLEEKKTVYFRTNGNEVKDSVNDGLIHTAAFVGGFAGVSFEKPISDWNPADANAQLSYIGGGLYKATFAYTALTEDKQVECKVAFDGTWDYSIGSKGTGPDNCSVTLPKDSTSVTVLCDEANQKVYASTTDTFDKDISIIGDVRGSENTWTPATTGYEFHLATPDIYVYTQALNKGSYGYKCVFGHADNWYGGDNIGLTLTEDTFVTFIYEVSSGKLFDSVNDNEKVAVSLGMSSTPVGGKVIENANGTVVFQMVADTGKTMKLFYAARSDSPAFTEVKLTETKAGVYASSDLYLGDAQLDLVYYYTVDGQKLLDGSAETVTIGGEAYSNFKRSAFTGRDVYVPGTLPGPTWDAASNKMTYKGNGIYTYTFKEVPSASYNYKIAIGGTWAENYGVSGAQDGGNYSISVTDPQDVTVYYSDLSHLAVTSLEYAFYDVSIEVSGKVTALDDSGLTGIYSNTLSMTAGSYSNVKITSKLGTETKTYELSAFTLNQDKEVTFYFAPTFEIYYHDADTWNADESKIMYNSRDEKYKDIYGAVPAKKAVKFSIETDDKITGVTMIIRRNSSETKEMTKDGAAVNGIQKWTTTVSFDQIGEYQYFFAIYNNSSVRFYSDDDGNYGTGHMAAVTEVKPYDIVVYKEDFRTPDWMKNAVIYHIFPDRFYNGDTANDKAQISARGAVDYEFVDWDVIPENPEQEDLLTEAEYKATGAYYGDRNWSNEIYGGDLKGIVQKIDYLKALGVNVIYLNPVFASISSHRYDTSDYSKIDPILGTLGDFEELSRVAKENGMHIVLDGVFNHVSDDSIYFDRYYKYLEAGTTKIGAYPYWAYVYDYMSGKNCTQSEAEAKAKEYFQTTYGITDFSYTEWFEVYTSTMKGGNGEDVKDSIGLRKDKPVYNYEGWWGYDSMPVIKSTNGSEFQSGDWGRQIIEGSGSIGQYWISKGSDGWRLDVANEVSDETWQHFRNSVKALNDGDAVIIGEIWDDATEYLLGDMYDSVMNYVFRNAVTGFAKGDSSVTAMTTLERIRERYPQEAFYAMMNLVASHDTTRLLSYLDGIDDDRNQKEVDKAFPTYEKTSDTAKLRQYLVAFLQFTYAGAPTIYYGDEVGVVGADDPDDRRTFCWGKGNKELVTWYAKLAAIRSQYEALRTGSVEPADLKDGSILSFVRRDSSDTLLVAANNADAAKQISITLADLNLTGTSWTELVSGNTIQAADGKITVSVPAYSGVILTTNAKTYAVDEEGLRSVYEAMKENPISGLDASYTKTIGEAAFTLSPTAIGAISYESDNDKVIAVQDGKLTIKGVGTAAITVKAAGNSNYYPATKTVTVTVKDKAANAITGVSSSYTKKYGDKAFTLSAKAVGTISYVSSAPEVVAVSGGKVTIKGAGKAVITITAAGNSTTASATRKVTITVKPGSVAGAAAASTKTAQASVTWKKSGGSVTGYEVQYSTNGKFSSPKTVTVKGASKASAAIKSLTAGKKYYFRVRGYKTVGSGKLVGAWSASKNVIVKPAATSKVTAKSAKSKKATVTWKKAAGTVTGYEIQYSTNKNYKSPKTTKVKGSKVSATLSKLTGGKKLYVRVRTYVTSGKTTVTSDWKTTSVKVKK